MLKRMLLIMICVLFVFSAGCDAIKVVVDTEKGENSDADNAEEAVGYVKNDESESVPIVKLEQTVIPNENWRDTEVSWYDQKYNYYVYNVGQIKNIPLTNTYSIFTYTGGNYTHKEEVVKATS